MPGEDHHSSTDPSTLVFNGDDHDHEDPGWADELESVAPMRVGRYLLLELIGEGGMGTVHSAFDPELDRTVAVKLMYARNTQERLRREAQAIAQVAHANVISVYDVGYFETGGRRGVFMVMELVEGLELQAWLDASPRSWREIVAVFAQAGRGLEAAHREGVVHRDFKLANVLVDRRGRVRVLDFGLARGLGPEPEPEVAETLSDAPIEGTADADDGGADSAASRSGASGLSNGLASGASGASGSRSGLRSMSGRSSLLTAELTRHGAVMGTPRYMSPEQHWSSDVEASSDQYSFCVALYIALYGRGPFEAAELDGYKAMVEAKLAGVISFAGAEVPEHLVAVLRRGLNPDPSARWPDMATLVEALERDPTLRRRRVAIAAAGLLTSALVIAGVLGWDARAVSACEAQREWLATAWDDDRREAITAAFGAVERGYARAALDHAITELDRHAEQLGAARAELCLAEHRSELDARVVAARSRCLDERLGELALVGERLSGADATLVEHTADVLATLPAAAGCAELEGADEAAATDSDPELRQAIRDELFAATLSAAQGREQDALAAHAAVLARARAHAEPALLTLVLVRGAELHGSARRLDEAEALASEAALLAEEHGLHDLSIDALASLGRTLSDLRGRWDDAQRSLDLAQAKFARAPGGSRGEWWLHYVQAGIHLQYGRHDEVVAEQELALAAVEGVGSAMDRAKILNGLALGQHFAGHDDEARAALEQTIALRVGLYGLDHPNLMYPYRTLARIAASEGEHLEALDHLARVIELGQRHHGPDAPGLVEPQRERAVSFRGLGRYADALAAYEEALRLRRVNGDPSSEELRLLSQVLLRLDRPEDALARAEEALAEHRDQLGPDEEVPWLRARFVMHRGEALLALGRFGDALIDFERATQLRVAEKRDGLLVRIWTDEGHCRLGLGDPEGAREAFERARAHLDTDDSVEDRVVGELEFGLAKLALDPDTRRVHGERAIAAFTAAGGDDDLADAVRAWLDPSESPG